ncbi:hypothetical protein DL771_005971 [Monosporascus sp. 5C6A]|nr:hypothetical protein DL771_005971 [Monosporascus sp. 5C6A]
MLGGVYGLRPPKVRCPWSQNGCGDQPMMDEATAPKEAVDPCLVEHGYPVAIQFFWLCFPGGLVITQDNLDVHDVNGPEKTSTLSINASIYTIGRFLGAATAFTIKERYGRKKKIIIGTVIMAIGVIL